MTPNGIKYNDEFKDFLKDEAIIEWKHFISPSEYTWERYTRNLYKYCQYVDMSPTQLVDLAESEAHSTMRNKGYRSKILHYRDSLESRKLAATSVRFYMAIIISFYSAFGITINLGKFKKVVSKKEHERIPIREELVVALNVAKPLGKAIILVGCSSGLSMNEICNLTIRQFREGYDCETGITTLHIRREKTGYDHITFLSPETSKAILTYLDERQKPPSGTTVESLDAYKKRLIYSEDGYLFIKSGISKDFLVTGNEELRKHDKLSITGLYRSINRSIEERKVKGLYGIIRSHNMRKWFYSTLINAGCDSMIAEFFMGHTLDNTRSAYFRATVEKLKQLYMKYVKDLTIIPDYDLEKSEEFQLLKQSNEMLNADKTSNQLAIEMLINKNKEFEERLDLMNTIQKLSDKWVKERGLIP